MESSILIGTETMEKVEDTTNLYAQIPQGLNNFRLLIRQGGYIQPLVKSKYTPYERTANPSLIIHSHAVAV